VSWLVDARLRRLLALSLCARSMQRPKGIASCRAVVLCVTKEDVCLAKKYGVSTEQKVLCLGLSSAVKEVKDVKPLQTHAPGLVGSSKKRVSSRFNVCRLSVLDECFSYKGKPASESRLAYPDHRLETEE
jgi:hypothetical protein